MGLISVHCFHLKTSLVSVTMWCIDSKQLQLGTSCSSGYTTGRRCHNASGCSISASSAKKSEGEYFCLCSYGISQRNIFLRPFDPWRCLFGLNLLMSVLIDPLASFHFLPSRCAGRFRLCIAFARDVENLTSLYKRMASLRDVG